jgi:acetolactate synthase-1/2/3 large subunit
MACTGGEILLDLLKINGIETIFCSPGSEWVSLWEGLSKRYGQGDQAPRYINCRHESLAVSMAMGYGEITGRLPAVLLHTGVGLLHAAMAIRNAYFAQVPIIVMSGEVRDHHADGEFIPPGSHWLSLLSDVGGPLSVVDGYVKWKNAIQSRDNLIDSLYRGCQIARTPPRGPVFLTLPTELLEKTLEEPKHVEPPQFAEGPRLRSSDLEAAAAQLMGSKQPLIITERAGKKPEAVNSLVELAELLSIPVFECTFPFYASFPKDHPLYMGNESIEALETADTVFIVGATTPWYPPSRFPKKDMKIIVLDETPLHERLPYWGYRNHLSLATPIGQGLASLVDIIRKQTLKKKRKGPHSQKRLNHWQAKHDRMVAQWMAEAVAEKKNKPISPKWFFHRASQLLPGNAMILDETIRHSYCIRRYLAEPHRYIKAGYGGLGVGLGEAAGVKLAYMDRPVIFIVGDGSFHYNPVLAGLGFCQEYQVPMCIIVLNNGGYMAMKYEYDIRYPKGWAASHDAYLGVGIAPDPDYVKVAEGFGAWGERLEKPEDIEGSLKRALGQIENGRTALIEVRIDSP